MLCSIITYCAPLLSFWLSEQVDPCRIFIDIKLAISHLYSPVEIIQSYSTLSASLRRELLELHSCTVVFLEQLHLATTPFQKSRATNECEGRNLPYRVEAKLLSTRGKTPVPWSFQPQPSNNKWPGPRNLVLTWGSRWTYTKLLD